MCKLYRQIVRWLSGNDCVMSEKEFNDYAARQEIAASREIIKQLQTIAIFRAQA